MLSQWKMKPVGVAGGQSALEVMGQATGDGSPFQLALIDVQMPGLDGFALAQQIRKDSRFDDTAIILMTSAV